jgi:hypothetical protein
MAGSLPMATTAESSVKVAVVDSGEDGRSAVYRRYNNAPRTLPWGMTTLRIVLYIHFQPLRGNVCYANRILG